MGSTRYDGEWEVGEALEFVRGLVAELELAGFAVGMTGSVLTKGSSLHDLDIIIYPLQSTKATDVDKAKAALKAKGGFPFLDSESLKRVWRRKGSMDEKTVEVWHFDKRRVDIFFMR